MLRQLGDPLTIAMAAVSGQREPTAQGSPDSTQRQNWLPIAVVLLLTMGTVLFLMLSTYALLLWLVGVALLWASRLWRVSEKLWGTLAPLGVLAATLLTREFPSEQACSQLTGQPGCADGLPAWVSVVFLLLPGAALLLTIAALLALLLRGMSRATARY